MTEKRLDIALIGASGYTGAELARLFLAHPKVRVVALTSEQSAGKKLSDLFPALLGYPGFDETLQAIGQPQGNSWPGLDALLKKSKFFFTALPHGTSTPCVAYLMKHGASVVDLSADFRLKDLAVYEKWYGKHEAKELIEKAVYALPEFHREALKKTKLAAVPGCYPTSANLALAPLMEKKWLDPKTIIVDSKSGVSGAGRTAKTSSLFSEVAGGIRAYGVTSHRHTPEIEQEQSRIFGKTVSVTFTPHLVPFSRGILSVAYANLTQKKSLEELEEVYEKAYQNEPFVRFRKSPQPLPDTLFVQGSYFCDLGIRLDETNQRVVIISAIDNLCRGASGMAVAAMNLMNGWPEDLSLSEQRPLFP